MSNHYLAIWEFKSSPNPYPPLKKNGIPVGPALPPKPRLLGTEHPISTIPAAT
jgi:hypothetical protein